MPRILMKEFSDIAISAGTAKISKIRKEKHKASYNPAQDYYKQIRESIIASHSKGYGINFISDIADKCPNPRRKSNYEIIASRYKQWHGKKVYEWFSPPRGSYGFSGTEIILNPEIGLIRKGVMHVIKLYFSEDQISQNRANYMIHLMSEEFPDTYQYHVLDIRRKKLFNPTGNHDNFMISTRSEIAGLEAAWDSV